MTPILDWQRGRSNTGEHSHRILAGQARGQARGGQGGNHDRRCLGQPSVLPLSGFCTLVDTAAGTRGRKQLDQAARKLQRRRRHCLPIAIAIAAVSHHRGLREERQLRRLLICTSTPDLARRHNVPCILHRTPCTPNIRAQNLEILPSQNPRTLSSSLHPHSLCRLSHTPHPQTPKSSIIAPLQPPLFHPS